MIYSSIHGRAGSDPVRSVTKNGRDMTRLSIVCDVAGHSAEGEEPFWVTVFAFNRSADDLERASKGQMVTCQGRLTRSHYTGKDGQQRESWSITADAVLVAASARPSGKRRSAGDSQGTGPDPRQREASRRFQDPGDGGFYSDPVPF